MGWPSRDIYPRGESRGSSRRRVDRPVSFGGAQYRFPRAGVIMKTIPDLAREILGRSPTPALPLPRLVKAIAEESTGPVVSVERVLAEIRSRPDLFRVVDPLIGPWRRATAKPKETPPWSPDTRVLGLGPGNSTGSPLRTRTSESLRCLGRRVDENSATDVARWLILIGRGSSRRAA